MPQKQKKEAVVHYLIKDTEFEKILNFLKVTKAIHKNSDDRLRKFVEGMYFDKQLAQHKTLRKERLRCERNALV